MGTEVHTLCDVSFHMPGHGTGVSVRCGLQPMQCSATIEVASEIEATFSCSLQPTQCGIATSIVPIPANAAVVKTLQAFGDIAEAWYADSGVTESGGSVTHWIGLYLGLDAAPTGAGITLNATYWDSTPARAAVVEDGSHDLRVATPAALVGLFDADDAPLYAVTAWKPADASSTRELWCMWDSVGGSMNQNVIRLSDTVVRYDRVDPSVHSVSAFGTMTANRQTCTIAFNGSTTTIYRDGAVLAGPTAHAAGALTLDSLSLGAFKGISYKFVGGLRLQAFYTSVIDVSGLHDFVHTCCPVT
jgi:hypothetical protein